MDVIANLPENTFKAYYKSLTNEQKAFIRNEFLKESGLSYPAFYSKLKSGKFTKLELKKISEICKQEFIG